MKIPHIFSYKDNETLINSLAEKILSLAKESIQLNGCFSIVLSGGSTPKALYKYMAKMDFPWQKTFIFWGDERCVSYDHLDSNYKMVKEALLDHIQIPKENVFPIPTHAKGHAEYEKALKKIIESKGNFDLVLLGLGQDGHTASLFSKSKALTEKMSWVTAVAAPKIEPQVPRITITLPVINKAKNVIIVVSGDKKAAIAKSALAALKLGGNLKCPASMIRPEGYYFWYVDFNL